MPFHREDRSVLRERARNQAPDPDVEVPELKDINMMKRLTEHIDANKHLLPRERDALDEEIDYIPDGQNTLDDAYRLFKAPGQSDIDRRGTMELIDRMIVRKGEMFIRAFAKENKLKQFSADLLRDVRNESNEGVKVFLCQAIGHLAEKRTDSWPELHRFIKMNVTSNDASLRKTILQLMGDQLTVKPLVPVGWAVVKDLIVESILGSDSTLWNPAINALGMFIDKKSNEDREMMEILYKVTPILLEHAGMECTPVKCEAIHSYAISCLYSIALDTPRVVRHHIEKIITICTQKIVNQIACKKWDDRHSCLQMLWAISDNFAPSIPVLQIPDIVTSCLLTISDNMNNTLQWLEYDCAIGKSKNVKDWALTMGHWYFEKIATAIGKKRISPHLAAITEEFLKDDKWEKRAAALVGWTVVGENFRNGRQMSIVDWALAVANDIHPRVRYYAIVLIGKMFSQYQQHNHSDRFEKALSSLISNLSDSSPRVLNAAVYSIAILLAIGECPKDFLAANYDAVVLPLMAIMEKWEQFDGLNQFMVTSTIAIISIFADAVGKDLFKVHFNQVKSSMVMVLRSIETFDDSLSIAVNRLCGVMGADSVQLLRLFTMKIDLKRDGHLFLETLIKAVHTDNFDGSSEMINEEKKVAYFVKKFAMEEECVEKVELTKEERETMMRIVDYV